MTVEPIRSLRVDQMSVHVFDSNAALGQRAAEDLQLDGALKTRAETTSHFNRPPLTGLRCESANEARHSRTCALPAGRLSPHNCELNIARTFSARR